MDLVGAIYLFCLSLLLYLHEVSVQYSKEHAHFIHIVNNAGGYFLIILYSSFKDCSSMGSSLFTSAPSPYNRVDLNPCQVLKLGIHPQEP